MATTGRLEFDKCVLLGKRLLVFPQGDTGVEWDGTALVMQGVRYNVGDQITVGGGPADRELRGTLHIPAGCVHDGLFLAQHTTPLPAASSSAMGS